MESRFCHLFHILKDFYGYLVCTNSFIFLRWWKAVDFFLLIVIRFFCPTTFFKVGAQGFRVYNFHASGRLFGSRIFAFLRRLPIRINGQNDIQFQARYVHWWQIFPLYSLLAHSKLDFSVLTIWRHPSIWPSWVMLVMLLLAAN